LNALKAYNLPALSTEELHYLAEVMKINFRARTLLGDPDFHKNPMDEFLSDAKINEWAGKIKKDKPLKLEPIKVAFNESDQTTHYTVLDSKGNAVSLTVTLNGNFGSKVVSNKYGIALNNEMDDFTTRPGEPNLYGLVQGKANFVEPGKRPLSAMSPTLVEDPAKEKIVMALGAPGGPRIITGVLQSLYRVIANDFDMDQAIQAPRVHHQFLPDTLFIDTRRFAPASVQALEKMGHTVKEGWHSKVNGVRVNKDGFLEAAFDSRSEGGAGGI
ncbi:MAG: gamma-glutamyltransferase, partial [Bdellovibrionales bacterium]|nr:gamma-glutamyltransferase [Bdellovibrionales bacterium]